jgi:excinuclease ABC subunit A
MQVELSKLDPKKKYYYKRHKYTILKSVDVAIPRNKLVVYSLSGSGKSSLVSATFV